MVVIAPEPFTPRVERLEALEGQTVAQVLVNAVRAGYLAAEDLPRTEVYVDGRRLEDRRAALDLIVRPGQMLNVTVLPQGGGRGRGNKVLQTVLTIAVIALSFYVGGGAATPALLDHLLVRTALAATVATVGQAAVNAAFGPKTTVDNTEGRDRYGLQGQSNPMRRGRQMPLRTGRRRYWFDLASSAYTETVGEEIYLHAIFGLHYGPVDLDESSLKLGETLVSSLPAGEVEYELALTPGPRAFNLYPMRTVQESYTDELDGETEAWVTHTTALDCEKIQIDVAWPQGLYYTNEKGASLVAGSAVDVQYRAVGSGTWLGAGFPIEYGPGGAPLDQGVLYVQTMSKDALNVTREWAVTKGQYEVRLKRRPHQAGQQGQFTDSTFWVALRTVEHKTPVVDETLACMAVRFRASSQINGTVPALSGVLEPICPVWDGEDWATEAPTSNPAAFTRWLLTGPAAARPLDPNTEIDASVAAQYELIAEREWDAAIDVVDDPSQEDLMLRLGQAGRFSTYWNGSKVCFVPDWEKPLARQLFTGRNAKGYRYRRVFPEPVHGVRVNFLNVDHDARQDELVVYNDGKDSTTAELFETLELGFACTAARAYREGRVFLAKNKLLVESHEWTAGLDAVASTYGDRVLVRHQSSLFGAAEGRVRFRRWSGALVAGVRLDEPVMMEAGKDYALDVRRADGVLTGLALTTVPGTSRELVFATPLEADEAPERNDLVAFGEVELTTEDLEIIDLDPKGSGEVQFIAQAYRAVDIMAAETGEIPELQTALSAKAEAPTPRIRGARGAPEGVTVYFDVPPQRTSPVRGFTARWRFTPGTGDSSNWRALDPLPPLARQVKTPPVVDAVTNPDAALDGLSVDVEVYAVLENGDVSQPGQASGVLVSRAVPGVRDFAVIGVVRTAPDGSSYPVAQISAASMDAGLVQDLVVEFRPAGEGAYTAAGAPLAAANPIGDWTGVKGAQSYDFRARWRTSDGWVGDWDYELDKAIPTGLVATDATHVGELSAADIADAVALGQQTIENLQAAIDQADATAFALTTLALKNATVQAALKALGFTPTGLPLGPVAAEQKTITASTVQDVSLIGLRNEAGTLFELSQTTLEIDGELLANHLTLLYGETADAIAAIASEASIRLTNDQAEATARLSLASTVSSNQSYALTQYSTLASDTAAVASELHILGAKNLAGSAFVFDMTKAQVGGGVSFGSRLSGIDTAVGANATSIATEVTNRTTAVSGVASTVTTLQTTVGGHTSTLSTHTGAIANLDGRTEAYLDIVAAAGGDPAYLKILADGYGSAIMLAATTLGLFNTSGGGSVIKVLEITNGEAHFSRVVFIEAGGKRMVLGPAFGASSDLLLWFGADTTALASMTKTNGSFTIATDGKAYYGSNDLDNLPSSGGGVPAGKKFDISGKTISTSTHTVMGSLDFTGVASGQLWEFSGNILISASATMSTGAGVYGWEIVETPTSGGTAVVLKSGTWEAADNSPPEITVPPVMAERFIAGTYSGAVTIALRVWKISGANITGAGFRTILYAVPM